VWAAICNGLLPDYKVAGEVAAANVGEGQVVGWYGGGGRNVGVIAQPPDARGDAHKGAGWRVDHEPRTPAGRSGAGDAPQDPLRKLVICHTQVVFLKN
jgi:hypothetical protein